MPIYTTTFPQDFWEHNFQLGAMTPQPPSLRIAYVKNEVAYGLFKPLIKHTPVHSIWIVINAITREALQSIHS